MATLYESLFIINPDEDDEGINAVIGTLRGHFENAGGNILNVNVWGRRKLAYPIKKKDDGVYVLFHLEGPTAMPQAVRDRVRIMESILRELIINLDDEPAAIARKAAEENAEAEAKAAVEQKEAAVRRAETKAAAIARPTAAIVESTDEPEETEATPEPATEPVAEEPVAEEPVAEEPVAEEPVAEEPVAEEPVAEEPVAEQPVAEEPVAEEPVAEEPVTEAPAAEETDEAANTTDEPADATGDSADTGTADADGADEREEA